VDHKRLLLCLLDFPLLSHIHPVHTLQSCFFMITFQCHLLSGLFLSGPSKKFYRQFFSPPCMLHALPSSLSFIWSSYNILVVMVMKGTYYKVPLCAVFLNLLSLAPSWGWMFFSALCSESWFIFFPWSKKSGFRPIENGRLNYRSIFICLLQFLKF